MVSSSEPEQCLDSSSIAVGVAAADRQGPHATNLSRALAKAHRPHFGHQTQMVLPALSSGLTLSENPLVTCQEALWSHDPHL